MGVAASAAVLLAAGLIVIETALFRPLAELTGWMDFAMLMLGIHAWIGLLEGLLTVAIASALTPLISKTDEKILMRPALIVAAAVIILVALSLPISSSLPDGYEAAAEASGMSWLLGS
jgi:hypothetical protein